MSSSACWSDHHRHVGLSEADVLVDDKRARDKGYIAKQRRGC